MNNDVEDEAVAAATEQLLDSMFDPETAGKGREVLADQGERVRTTHIEFGEAAVVGEDLLVELFGTETPGKATVLDKTHRLIELLPTRWTAVCVPIYEDGEPSEYYFVGYSGD